MAYKKKILLQLDSDPVASSFDAIVAVDSGIDQLLPYGGVTPENIQGLVHGAMFTRGGNDLASTAIFLGGSNVAKVQANLFAVTSTFFGPVRVSVMIDPNGCNTTAVAAFLSAKKHSQLQGNRVIVLGGTGPVGSRIATLAASAGNEVTIVSRSESRASQTASDIAMYIADSKVVGIGSDSGESTLELVQRHDVVFTAGAAGVQFLPDGWLDNPGEVVVAIDCNAVPPEGLGGVSAMDKAKQVGFTTVYGAVGIGGLKMKIHKRCIAKLFEKNDLILDLNEIFHVAATIE